MTDTCLLSDIVLPACTSFERSELKAWGGGYLTCTTPVIEPLYESRSDVQIICDLSKAMHLGDELLARGRTRVTAISLPICR
jgi:anaerobic selenocysteine-containing dehydrogenase